MYKAILQTQNYIDGTFLQSDTLIANIPMADHNQVALAIQSAYNALPVFREFSAEKRAQILIELYDQLNDLIEEFAQLIAAEGGKPISYARTEVQRALDNIQTGIRETLAFSGKRVPIDYLNGKNKTAYTIRKPAGVVLGITPFNFPLNLALHKLIPAIAVGAPIILKPAPQAPLTLLGFAKLLQNTTLPAGAVNILMTDNTNAQTLVEDDRIKILSFTGSDKVGWMLKNLAGKKKVLLEMGGNAAAIIDVSANLQRAARKLVYGSFLNAGQICISTQRIYVLDKVYEEFVNFFIEETRKILSGDVRNEDVINSSMISKNDLIRVQTWINEAVQQGATILYGGKVFDEKTNIFEPTILTNTNISMKINSEEAFAPIVMIEKTPTFKQAIELVNESRYGLQAGVFTDSLDNMLVAQKDLEVGGVIINDVPGFRIDSMPYGGIKDSGVGREGAKYVMEEFTEPKLIVISS